MEEQKEAFVSCHFCSEKAITKAKIYEPEMRCHTEVDVCEDCALAIEDNIL